MAAEIRSECVIIVTQPGRAERHNVEKWKEWAGEVAYHVESPFILEALDKAHQAGRTHAWLCDAGYEPLPTSFRKLLSKKVWNESVFTIFKAGRPTFVRPFYDAKFSATYDAHDKFGGLRYVSIEAMLHPLESDVWDQQCQERNIDYVDMQASKLSFPFSVFHLSSGEPDPVVISGLASVQRFYPTQPHYGTGNILQSHKELAAKSDSNMFLVMDADLILEKSLGLETFTQWDEDSVHVWYVRNPVNGLIYGHGGPKAFNRNAFLNLDNSVIDVTTSSNNKAMVVHEECVGIHRFNWSAEASWRCAFREAAKLTWAAEHEEQGGAAQERLDIWLNDELINEEEPFAEECLDGAQCGSLWARDAEDRTLINNFQWLHEQYDEYLAAVELIDELEDEDEEDAT